MDTSNKKTLIIKQQFYFSSQYSIAFNKFETFDHWTLLQPGMNTDLALLSSNKTKLLINEQQIHHRKNLVRHYMLNSNELWEMVKKFATVILKELGAEEG